MTKENATITSKKITNEKRFLNKFATFFFQVEYAKRNAYMFDNERYMLTKGLYKSVLCDLNKKGINCKAAGALAPFCICFGTTPA